MVAPAIASLMVSLCGVRYAPGGGAKVGVALGGRPHSFSSQLDNYFSQMYIY